MDLKFVDPDTGRQITTGFLSKHVGTDRRFNENNEGIGYITGGGLLGGVYKNSLGKPSVYLGKEWKTDAKKIGPVELAAGLLAGGVTGYGKPITPFVMPEGIATMGDHSLALGFLPPVKDVTPATFALQYRRKF